MLYLPNANLPRVLVLSTYNHLSNDTVCRRCNKVQIVWIILRQSRKPLGRAWIRKCTTSNDRIAATTTWISWVRCHWIIYERERTWIWNFAISANEIMLSGVLDKLQDDAQEFDLFSGGFLPFAFGPWISTQLQVEVVIVQYKYKVRSLTSTWVE